MNKAIIFNLHFNGLGVARALGKNGIEVIGMDCKNKPVGRYSKYIKEFIKVENPNIDDKKFIEDLIKYGKTLEEKAILIPTNDVWSIAVSKYKNKLEKYFYTYNSDFNVIEEIIDKKKFYKKMNDNNILVPQTYQIKKFKEIEQIKNKIKFPIILKPNARMEVNRKKEHTNIYNKNRLIEINDFDELLKYKNLIDNYDFIVQQKIEGLSNNMYTIGVYADKNSDVKAVFSGRKVRGYPADIGDCFAGEALWKQELVDLAKKIIKISNYTGIAEVEFKYNEKDGEYYLIEINPRTWSWVGITPNVDVNLPLIAYKDLLGDKIDYVEMNKNKKVLWTRSIDDKYNCKSNYKNINSIDFKKSIIDWENSLKEYDEVVFADLDKEDINPGLYWKKIIKLSKIKGKIKNIFS